MTSREQLRLVGMSCRYYRNNSSSMYSGPDYPKSCENCVNWTGERCKIDVFDEVLSGLDQG